MQYHTVTMVAGVAGVAWRCEGLAESCINGTVS